MGPYILCLEIFIRSSRGFDEYYVRRFLYTAREVLEGRSSVAKVSCILRHRGVQLILAYSWTRPAILVAGKDRG